MMITSVTLQNYGAYKGKHMFDLRAERNRPVILIGGSNGAGKTTIFESIMVCLYGGSYIGKNSTKKYTQFLREKIHNGLTGHDKSFSVEVEFDIFHMGNAKHYSVRRVWTLGSSDLTEDLYVNKDGKRLGSLEKSHWQEFIEELIPIGISKLFFFDGEKIVNVTRDDNGDAGIQSSFRTLLGLDVIDQLREDLRLFIMRNTGTGAKGAKVKHDEYLEKRNEAEDIMEKLETRIAEKKNQRDTIEKKITECEQKISSIGGRFADKRDKLHERNSKLRSEKIVLEDDIRHILGGAIPLCLIPEHIKDVKTQIIADRKIALGKLERDIVLKTHKNLLELLNTKFWKENTTSVKTQKAVLKKIALVCKMDLNEGIPMMDMSQSESDSMLTMIDNIHGQNYKRLKTATKKLSNIENELENVETALASVPKDDEILPIVKKTNDYNYENGILTGEIDHMYSQLLTKRTLIKMLNTKMRDLLKDIYKNEDVHASVKLAGQVRNALDKYIVKLRTRKIAIFEQHLMTTIQTLMHKKDLIKSASIDPESFKITLYDSEDNPISKNILAMGERQMFAMSILVALSKTSGKPLPFIIDTPLARLDSMHRNLLVDKFFNSASHQIIILSTDTEINQAYYKKLIPNISQAYTLRHVHGKKYTMSEQKYFWSGKK